MLKTIILKVGQLLNLFKGLRSLINSINQTNHTTVSGLRWPDLVCIVLYCTSYDPPSRLLLTGEEPTFSYTKIYYIRPH